MFRAEDWRHVSHGELLKLASEHWSDSSHTTLAGEEPVLVGDSQHAQSATTVHPYWDLLSVLPVFRDPRWPPDAELLIEVLPAPFGPFPWQVLQQAYSWSIPTPGDLTWLSVALADRPVVEVGAGRGYWSWQLSQLDHVVEAFDAQPGTQNQWCLGTSDYFDVHPADWFAPAKRAVGALLVSWPPPDDSAVAAITGFGGDMICFVGEPNPQICGGPRFMKALAAFGPSSISECHANLYGFRDEVRVYRRR